MIANVSMAGPDNEVFGGAKYASTAARAAGALAKRYPPAVSRKTIPRSASSSPILCKAPAISTSEVCVAFANCFMESASLATKSNASTEHWRDASSTLLSRNTTPSYGACSSCFEMFMEGDDLIRQETQNVMRTVLPICDTE